MYTHTHHQTRTCLPASSWARERACLSSTSSSALALWYDMGWLRLVGSLKLEVSTVKEPYKRDYILQKRPVILRSLHIVATPHEIQKRPIKETSFRERDQCKRPTDCGNGKKRKRDPLFPSAHAFLAPLLAAWQCASTQTTPKCRNRTWNATNSSFHVQFI